MALGISGIGMGLDPMMLGGMYGSYDNYMPSMYGMSGMGSYNPMFGGIGAMSNMYQQMAQIQQQMELGQLIHSGNMHDTMKDVEVSNYGRSDRALIEKISQNGSVQSLLQNLVDKMHNGEMSGVCDEYDKLQTQILRTYRDEIVSRGTKENPIVLTREIIDQLYATVTKGSNLRDDIMKYGESSFVNGYQQGFNPGHGKKYTAEVMNHIYGEGIGNAQSNEDKRAFGYIFGRGAHSLKTGAGSALLTGATTLTAAGLIRGAGCLVPKELSTVSGVKFLGLRKGYNKTTSFLFKKIPNTLFKKTPAIALGALLIGTVADLIAPRSIEKMFGISAPANS